MMAATHQSFAALAGASFAAVTGQPFPLVVLTAVVATATSHGWLSPDVDQTGAWRAVSRFAIGPLRRFFTHRYGLSHWWGIPVVAFWLSYELPEQAQWAAVALIIGWVSHLAGDFLFGKLAVFPWGWWKIGLGLRTDGVLESGKVQAWGRDRRMLTFSPARVVIGAALLWVLVSSAGFGAGVTVAW